MKHFKLLILTLLCTVELFAVTVPNDLAKKLVSIPLDKSAYSIHVQAVNASEPIVSWKTHTKRFPASVIKLLTSYSALLSLGYEYRWETKFYHTGELSNGVLRGNLIVQASGDPTLENKDIDTIVEQIKAVGIRKITGNIVIDRTIFQISSNNSSGFDRNIYSPYNAMPDALMFNERKSTVCVTFMGKQAEIRKDVPDQSYQVVNNLKLVNSSCRGKNAWPQISVNQSKLVFSGQISRHCGERTVCKVLTKPYLSFYYALKAKLRSSHVDFKGKMELQSTSKKAKYLFSHYSDTLEVIISRLAKESNNVFARQLLLTLGAQQYSKPSTLFKGRKAIEKILGRYNILEQGSTFVDNGSGLSRISTTSAQSLANLLVHGAQHYGQRWMNTLSIAGIDGTLKNRFSHSAVFGRAWMKTGTINNVSNVAGYVEGITGQRYVVVVLVNNKFAAKYGRQLANTVIEWVAATK